MRGAGEESDLFFFTVGIDGELMYGVDDEASNVLARQRAEEKRESIVEAMKVIKGNKSGSRRQRAKSGARTSDRNRRSRRTRGRTGGRSRTARSRSQKTKTAPSKMHNSSTGSGSDNFSGELRTKVYMNAREQKEVEEKLRVEKEMRAAAKAARLADALPILPHGTIAEREASAIAAANYQLSTSSLSGAKTAVELLVISLCRSLRVNARGGALLLSVHAPRLVSLLIDGPYKPALRWLRDLLSPTTVDRLTAIFTQRPQSVPVFLRAVRSGLVSTNSSVAQMSIRVMTRVINRLLSPPGTDEGSNVSQGKGKGSPLRRSKPKPSKLSKNRNGAHRAAWLWFIQQRGGGLTALIECCTRHASLRSDIARMVEVFASGNFKELFNVHMSAPEAFVIQGVANDEVSTSTLMLTFTQEFVTSCSRTQVKLAGVALRAVALT